MVANLLDSTNASSPIAGSLREAITRPPSDGIITFDPTLFSDAVGPQTLVLNGAVGRLQFNSSAPLTIQGPGKFASGPFAGQYKLIIQSDIGFLSASVTNGGNGFRVGDILQQGFDQFNGGARFQVLSINELSDNNPTNGKGAITSVSVIQPGANFSLQATGAVLSPTGTGINQLTPVGASTGSGAFLQVNPTEFGTATGLVQQQMTGGTSIISASGIHFGTARGDALIVGLGNLTVNDCRFSNTDKFGLPKQSLSYIRVNIGGGNLSISNSAFIDSGAAAVSVGGNTTNLVVSNSVFDGNDDAAVSYRSGRNVTISDSTFSNNGDGVVGGLLPIGTGGVFITSANTVTVTNSLFTGNTYQNDSYDAPIGGSALALNNVTTATVTNCTFDGNQVINAGFELPGEPDTTTFNTGGAAILSLGNGSLAVSNSLFRNNKILDVKQEASGGGAIYNYNSPLTITACGFEDNLVRITGYPTSSPRPDTTDYTANPELQPSSRYSGGGALYSGGSTQITGSYFSGNSVESQVDFWEHAIDESTIASNPLFSGGGALYLTSNGLATVNNLSNTTFTRNSAIQTAVTTDLRAAGKGGTVFLPLGAIPSAVITIPVTPFTNSIVTLNSLNSSYSVANPAAKVGYTVAPPVALPPTPAGGPGAIARGDFNNDGVFDFAIVNPLVNTVSIFAGSIDPLTFAVTFSLQTTLTSGTTVGAAPIAVTVGDFDNDGNDDIASANSGENSLSVFLGVGDGTFGTASQVALPGTPVSIAAGDFNGDGLDDVTAISSTGTISQLNWSNVSKGFANPVNSVFSGFPATIALGDINGDAVLDAVVAEPAANKIGVYLGQANGSYVLNQSINTDNPLSFNNPKVATQPVVARLADLDGDGLVDLYAALKGTSDIFVLGNTGATKAGTFFPATRTNNDYYGVLNSPVDVASMPGATKLAPPNLVVASDSTATASILINNSSAATPGSPSFVRRALPSGKGLNGGAMIIADGRTAGNPNNVISNSYNGSSNTSIVNCTITGNSLVNPFATSSNSNYSTIRLFPTISDRGDYMNASDTGGILADINANSSVLTKNTILNNNTGILYLQQGSPSALIGEPVVGNTSTSIRNRINSGATSLGTFGSASNSMYDPEACYGYNNPNEIGKVGLSPRQGDITQSDNTANLDPAGLQTDVRAPQIGLTSNPAFAGRIKYIPIERLSPARDGGTSVNVYPTPLATDARGANRLININVDIGAFEVQYATQTSVQSPVLAPADST
ncbi:MAG: beta strand repeat-containing protein, partial [Planctomycetota bacterium]